MKRVNHPPPALIWPFLVRSTVLYRLWGWVVDARSGAVMIQRRRGWWTGDPAWLLAAWGEVLEDAVVLGFDLGVSVRVESDVAFPDDEGL